jgi:hypothetical protein
LRDAPRPEHGARRRRAMLRKIHGTLRRSRGEAAGGGDRAGSIAGGGGRRDAIAQGGPSTISRWPRNDLIARSIGEGAAVRRREGLACAAAWAFVRAHGACAEPAEAGARVGIARSAPRGELRQGLRRGDGALHRSSAVPPPLGRARRAMPSCRRSTSRMLATP